MLQSIYQRKEERITKSQRLWKHIILSKYYENGKALIKEFTEEEEESDKFITIFIVKNLSLFKGGHLSCTRQCPMYVGRYRLVC